MQKISIHLCLLVCAALALPGRAAVYKEAGGRIVIEAEHFDSRTTNSADNHRFHIVPDENSATLSPADPGFSNARGDKYVQALPDVAGGGVNYNTVDQVATPHYVEYKVQIGNPGRYRLWLRWGGYDGSSDSMYAQVRELMTTATPAGAGPDWYRYVRNIAGDFSASGGWNGDGAPSTDAANRVGGGGGEIPAIWNIPAAGTYTIRLGQREDGCAVDALIFQLASLPAPANPGPAESLAVGAPDTGAPTIVEASTRGNPNGVLILFSEAVSPATATNKNNYAINNGVTVNSAALYGNDFTVLLTTTPLTGGPYELTVNGVQDTASPGNTIAANTKVQFSAVDGFIERRIFFVSGIGANIPALTNNAKFRNNQPDLVFYTNQLGGFNDWADNYGTQFRGYVHPPVTGNYVFFICSDDNSRLFLSTDEDPANKKWIGAETGWSTTRQWVSSAGGSDVTAKRSDQYATTEWPGGNVITLTAGRKYYIEVLHGEGGGGDNIGVTWMLPGGAEPADGDPPIQGQFLSGFGYTPGVVSISAAPTNTTVLAPNSVTFRVTAGGTPPYAYQWLRDGTPIAGATGSSYTIPITRSSDNNAKFSVRVSNDFSTAASAEATLTVTPDTTPPRPYTVTSVNAQFRVVTLAFSELMDKASAETAANYVFTPGNVTATNVVLDATGTNVTITTGAPLTQGVTNTLTLGAVKDLGGNSPSPNAIKFSFNGVTYAANILIDGPIAYYRFDEPAGSTVATNSGTTASTLGHGLYMNDGGAPGAHADPGPLPPSFAGFDPNNRAGTFDGLGEWVDTQQPFLDGLSAFSLEYWVKPAGRATQGNRVGIVGQNDAVEYGFIDPNTIQIWTPGGGSLNTAYSFPDNEWHHIATIADGTNLKNYYDGVLINQGGSGTANYGNSAFNVHIAGGGVFDASGNFFPGQIDEVAIFNKAIPAARIAAHFKAGKEGGVLVNSEVTVQPEFVPPKPLVVTSVSPNFRTVSLYFDEALDETSAKTAANYVFTPGNIAAASVTLTNGTNVTISTSAALTAGVTNTLTLNGIKDLAGNTIVANTGIQFSFRSVTYADNILFDGPIAYYRFEEPAGTTVATNSGTTASTAGHGMYMNDAGAPGAHADPGPQPPLFVGFDAGNRAATLDGIGEWVDANAPFLQNRAAFSLEYWVKTRDRLNQGNRVGIVGQNDAIEYGFINPTTIQIWTPGGGSLNTAYGYPDNEWHHIATIADGTSLKTYYDGVLRGSGGTATADYGGSTFNVHIGGGGVFDGTGNFFPGQIDEVAIFDKAIPAERIAAHFKAGKEGGVLTLSGPVSVVGTQIKLTITRSGNNLNISWTPSGGTLQSTAALGSTAAWSDVGTANPASVTIGTGSRFYRVRQ